MPDNIPILISGLGRAGKMARIIAQGIPSHRDGRYFLLPRALTGPDEPATLDLDIQGAPQNFALVPPREHEEYLATLKKTYPGVHAIDFAKGKGVADKNAEMYFRAGIPFVMGSTGVSNDYDGIAARARETGVDCVAYPNMDTRIVAWMAGIKHMAENYAGAFEGADVELRESHQVDKPSTSGTMRATLKALSALTRKDLTEEDIVSIRDPKVQRKMLKVPEDWIDWHAYHLFRVSNAHDGVEDYEILTLMRHGGDCYKRGALVALDHLVDGKSQDHYSDMPDVIKATAA